MRNEEQYRKSERDDHSSSDQAEHEQALKIMYMPAMPPTGLFVWSKKTLQRLLEKVRS
ncbi:hypothetical protein KZO85_10555 [Chromohalobacter canadensis]|uniref:hypothetical protein n=1 Tax=Chromohalobacter canadensis TaxID=141389 RepID=UPI0021C22744|nr:hypothetical protein [Chromohalobacter canadensis]MCT8469024.1 hypothetical protein [Chromohalobacter canadensis]MCT8472786.1 hypothetical protein [Chromohalobacter canadensis]MCT8500238.1 hypothetical protein [Chromohalobacter canadensis]